MNDTILSFIGGGNMAGSLIAGLIADGWNPASIRVSDTDTRQLERLSQRFPIETSSDNAQAVAGADVLVLAVKPQVLEGVAHTIASSVSRVSEMMSL